MNLSIETKLAAALTASFVALVLGAIAQTQNDTGTAGSNEDSLTDSPTSISPSLKEFQSSSWRGTKHGSGNAQADHSCDD